MLIWGCVDREGELIGELIRGSVTGTIIQHKEQFVFRLKCHRQSYNGGVGEGGIRVG